MTAFAFCLGNDLEIGSGGEQLKEEDGLHLYDSLGTRSLRSENPRIPNVAGLAKKKISMESIRNYAGIFNALTRSRNWAAFSNSNFRAASRILSSSSAMKRTRCSGVSASTSSSASSGTVT